MSSIGNLCKITLGLVVMAWTNLALKQMGPVFIFATLFNFAEKLAGISGGIIEEVEEVGCTRVGGLVIGSTGMKGEVSLSWVGAWAVLSSWSLGSSLC